MLAVLVSLFFIKARQNDAVILCVLQGIITQHLKKRGNQNQLRIKPFHPMFATQRSRVRSPLDPPRKNDTFDTLKCVVLSIKSTLRWVKSSQNSDEITAWWNPPRRMVDLISSKTRFRFHRACPISSFAVRKISFLSAPIEKSIALMGKLTHPLENSATNWKMGRIFQDGGTVSLSYLHLILHSSFFSVMLGVDIVICKLLCYNFCG